MFLSRNKKSMFLSRNKKINVYPCYPQFYYIKVGFKGSTLYRFVFSMKPCIVGIHQTLLRHFKVEMVAALGFL